MSDRFIGDHHPTRLPDAPPDQIPKAPGPWLLRRPAAFHLLLLLILAGCMTGARDAPIPPSHTLTGAQPAITVRPATTAPVTYAPPAASAPQVQAQAGAGPLQQGETPPAIDAISTNAGDYPAGVIPRYAKLEVTFQVATIAGNLQLPYDPAPPPGLQPAIGVSVDAEFTPDNWQTVYRQPAFLYQEFLSDVRRGQEWFYPTDTYSWKVRFAPPQAGAWQFRLTARDAGGQSTSPPQAFTVVPSPDPGFVRVSQTNPRVFERENGDFFPALGYNMIFDRVSWTNPVLDNQANFETMSANGIQLIRIWLSQWGIYGPSWNPWNSADPAQHSAYVPFSGLTFSEAYGDGDVSMRVDAGQNPCMFIGAWKARPALQRQTDYRVRVRLKTVNVSGPRVAGQPYGFVAKMGGWLDGATCSDPGVGATVTPHVAQTGGDWQILEGAFNSGDDDFLPLFYLVMDNASGGTAFVDHVWIEEDVGDGTFGPNVVSKPWMAHHLYMEQRNSYAFDRVLDLAAQNDISFKIVIGEKLDWIFNHIDDEGQPIPFDQRCYDGDPNNDPPKCPGNQWFYGDHRNVTKVRWLQQAWWRYLQARWGYATNIHSWELLNEGDPASTRHFALADEFGAYMRQFAPNHHLVTTSFWHSFPRAAFWTNDAYPHVDYADVHRYITRDEPESDDAALATYGASIDYGGVGPDGIGKPVMRGETGFVLADSGTPLDLLQQDEDGVWLHNFLWGGLNAGGLIESYWYEQEHIFRQAPNGAVLFDHRPHFRPYANFLQALNLNRGRYREAALAVNGAGLRAWGQIDPAAGRAHLWIHNEAHRWPNAVAGQPINPVSGAVVLHGLQPASPYVVQWWDTWQPDVTQQILRTGLLHSDAQGRLSLPVSDLSRDIAVTVRAQREGDLFLPLIASHYWQ